jgi:RNA polymerase sigma factor (sigma-70 family)
MAAESLADQSDRQLLERLLAGPAEEPFEALLRRHGPMVYRVCWRVLQQAEDAEDAFQATFLLLARKLGTLKKRDSLASWLHGVAHRVALDARKQAARRRRHEARAAAARAGPQQETTWEEVRTVLDAELAALSETLRLPLILCYLEGLSQEEAVRRLGCSKRTLQRRLEEARAALGRRLTRKGFIWSAAVSGLLVSDCVAPAAIPPKLIGATVVAAAHVLSGRAAVGAVSAKVMALMEGVVKTMVVNQVKAVIPAVVLVGVLFSGGLALLARMGNGPARVAARPPRDSGKPAAQHLPPGLESRPAARPSGEAAPALAPLDLLLKASEEVRKPRSAAGTAAFEAYEFEREAMAQPHTKGKVQVYFDGGKYQLRYKYEYRQRQSVPAKFGDGEKVVDVTPADVAVIFDGAVTREVVYSTHWFRPTGCQVNLRERLRDASWGIWLDHPAELWREALDVKALVKDLGRDALTLTRVGDGTLRGSYRLKNAPKVRVEFEARPADGYNVSSVRAFNEGESRPAQTAKVTWSRAKDVWYVKELVTELDSRAAAGTGKLYRLVFRYESFETGAKVDPALFTLDCLAIPPNTRIMDQRSGGGH